MADRKGRSMVETLPFPACDVGTDGKVIAASRRISDVFLYDGIDGQDIFALTGFDYDQLADLAREGGSSVVRKNDRSFSMSPVFTDGESADGGISVSFTDITEYVDLENRYEREKLCIAILNIDNYDELISSTDREDRAGLVSAIDKQIRFWGQKMQASVTKSDQNKYVLIFEHKAYEEQARSNFTILDDARQIETEADFPVTFSIGIGIGGDSPGESDTFASDALAVALGRGGDQVVVKEENTISYFGGKSQTVEKGNKGKSRIIGIAMKRLIDTASSVVIMGHKSPDMDSFGSALGVYRMAIPMNKNTYILVDEYNEALEALYTAAKQSGDYNLISSKNLKGMKPDDMLVIVVDTHRPSMVECPELLDKAGKVVVIDHHRKAEESIENPSLQYQEPYASSTSELITEILEYTIDRKQLTKLEVEALLAGIMVDTNRFSVKTGVRTFEAAAWLKRAGADTGEVKKFFQTDKDTFLKRAGAISRAEFDREGMAFSICEGENEDAQIIDSQAADEMLTVRGVKASFVAGTNSKGQTVISARSLGEVNVQVIMEKLGGGGHLTTAGAQVDMTPEEAIDKIKEILETMK